MTNEEARYTLKSLKDYYNDKNEDSYVGFDNEDNEALDMAIKALEIASCIKEKCAYCPHCEHCDVDDETLAINALEQQSCEDAISRETVLDIINNPLNIRIDEIIEKLPSVTPKTVWIPCSDKMPDINIHVLAQFVMGGMAECYYAHNWWHIVGGFRISGDEVIAWMPLPEPYTESEEEG